MADGSAAVVDFFAVLDLAVLAFAVLAFAVLLLCVRSPLLVLSFLSLCVAVLFTFENVFDGAAAVVVFFAVLDIAVLAFAVLLLCVKSPQLVFSFLSLCVAVFFIFGIVSVVPPVEILSVNAPSLSHSKCQGFGAVFTVCKTLRNSVLGCTLCFPLLESCMFCLVEDRVWYGSLSVSISWVK